MARAKLHLQLQFSGTWRRLTGYTDGNSAEGGLSTWSLTRVCTYLPDYYILRGDVLCQQAGMACIGAGLLIRC